LNRRGWGRHQTKRGHDPAIWWKYDRILRLSLNAYRYMALEQLRKKLVFAEITL